MEKNLLTAVTDCPDFERKEVLNKNYYFDNERVERLMYEYLAGACIDVNLRDEIMVHASELIRQLIKAHNLNQICPGKDGAVNGDLFQTAWLQIESSLYKYEARPHCSVCYNSLRPNDSLLVDDFWFVDRVIKRIKVCPRCKSRLTRDTIYYRGKSKVFNFWCINPNSLLLTTNGIRSIGSIDGGGVFGLDGMRDVVNKFNKPKLDTLIVTTELGYSIEGTPLHRLYRLSNGCPEWVMMKDLCEGDLLAIQYNQQYFVGDDDLSDIVLEESGEWNPPSKITGELAYLFGLYLAEGSFNPGMLVIYNTDEEVINVLKNNSLGLKFGNTKSNTANYTCCKRFSEFFRKIGFSNIKAYQKQIPNRLLRMSKDNIIQLLRGYADGDGHSSRFNGNVGFTSTSTVLLNQVRMLLLNFGILTKITKDKRTEREFIKKGKLYKSKLHGAWQLLLSTTDSLRFYNQIGFNILYKQNKQDKLPMPEDYIWGVSKNFRALYDKYGSVGQYNKIRKYIRKTEYKALVSSVAERLVFWSAFRDDVDYQFIQDRLNEFNSSQNNIKWLPIRSIVKSQSEVCDIEVDSESHSYIANGFVSHNSQVGRTVVLAYIKKENRDHKNSNMFQTHLENKTVKKSEMLERFTEEARDIFRYNDDYNKILDAIKQLYNEDDKPYDGLITKLVDKTDLSRSIVTEFLRTLRLRSKDFTDSPVNEENENLRARIQVEFEEFD